MSKRVVKKTDAAPVKPLKSGKPSSRTARKGGATSPEDQIVLRRTDEGTPGLIREIRSLHETIQRRAYEIFANRQGPASGELGDWVQAEREVVNRPPIGLYELGTNYIFRCAVGGFQPDQLEIEVTGTDIVVTSNAPQRFEDPSATIHLCEFSGGRLFRATRFPGPVDPHSAVVTLHQGLLSVTVAMASHPN